jgi:hypothetical protein
VVSESGFGSTEAVPQGMQRLIGFASRPRQEESDAARESPEQSPGDKRERKPKQSHSAPAGTRRDQ